MRPKLLWSKQQVEPRQQYCIAPFSNGLSNCHYDPTHIYTQAIKQTLHRQKRKEKKQVCVVQRERAKEKLKDEEESSVVAGAMSGYVGGDLG